MTNEVRCARCGVNLMGWKGFLEVYDPTTLTMESYRLCPDCQSFLAREIRVMIRGETE